MKNYKEKRILKAFIDKSMFNSGEVDFLVVKDKKDGTFHIFWHKDVVEAFSNNFNVENSKARAKGQMDAQKVIFKVNNRTIGEIEIRNESDIHYREVKFWLDKKKSFQFIKKKHKKYFKIKPKLFLYGKAISKLRKIYKD